MSEKNLAELRYRQINSFKASGMSQAAWCQENQMKLSTLRYWLRKIQAEESESYKEDWVSIAVSNPVNVPVQPIIVRVGAFSIEIQPGFDRHTLTDVIAAIRGLC